MPVIHEGRVDADSPSIALSSIISLLGRVSSWPFDDADFDAHITLDGCDLQVSISCGARELAGARVMIEWTLDGKKTFRHMEAERTHRAEAIFKAKLPTTLVAAMDDRSQKATCRAYLLLLPS